MSGAARASARPGRLIGVVGPSGVGKDTVMDALVAARPGIGRVRRVISRPEGLGGEVFDGVSADEFARRRVAGAFALSWQAHGINYGVPATVSEPLAQGRDVLVNLSRAVLLEAEERFDRFVTLSLTAPHSALAERLAGRGRETGAEIEARLARAGFALPPGLAQVVEVTNDGPLAQAVAQALAALYPESARRSIT